METAIRWDTTRMEQLASNLEAKAGRIQQLRNAAFEALLRGDSVCELRTMVIAAEWARFGSAEIGERRRLLVAAEQELLWDLGRLQADTGPGWRPELRGRAISAITNELDAALRLASRRDIGIVAATLAEARVAHLTLELAIATRAGTLMAARHPEPTSVATLSRLIDYLSYEIAKGIPPPAVDWVEVADATAAIRRYLDESWFHDVSRRDLMAITEIVSGLGGGELDLVIGQLSDSELYRWFRELDGILGGNLDTDQEAELFAQIARSANGATLFRLAGAERSAKFDVIAASVQAHAPVEVAMEFIEIAAAHAATSEEALLAALAGLTALGQRERSIVMAALHRNGLITDLDDATKAFLARHRSERDDPILIEFFEGLLGALGGTIKTIAELSIMGLVDSHSFREAWSRLAKVVVMMPTDPVQFAALVIDLDTLRTNPSKWLGAAFADVVSLGLGRLARLGRLGTLAKSVADWVKRFGARVVVRHRELELELGHVGTALDRLGTAAAAVEIRAVIDDVLLVESYSDQLGELAAGLEELDAATTIRLMRAMAQAAIIVTERIGRSAFQAAGLSDLDDAVVGAG